MNVIGAGQEIRIVGLEQLTNSAPKLERLRTIAQQTVNTGAKRIRTRLDRTTRSEVKLQQAYVLKRITVTNASLRNDVAESSVFAPKDPFLLTRYGAQQVTTTNKRAGISVQVSASGPRRTMPHAFFVRLRSGAQAVAVRKPGDRTRIKVLYGPDVDQIFHTRLTPIISETTAWVRGELNRRIALESGT